MPLTVPWFVTIDGKPATDRFNPYVVEIETVDGDSARITLRDDGRIIMPARAPQSQSASWASRCSPA